MINYTAQDIENATQQQLSELAATTLGGYNWYSLLNKYTNEPEAGLFKTLSEPPGALRLDYDEQLSLPRAKYIGFVPHYASDISAAWQLVERMQKLHFSFTLHEHKLLDTDYQVTFADGNYAFSSAKEAKAPLAITKAALRALLVSERAMMRSRLTAYPDLEYELEKNAKMRAELQGLTRHAVNDKMSIALEIQIRHSDRKIEKLREAAAEVASQEPKQGHKVTVHVRERKQPSYKDLPEISLGNVDFVD